MKWNAADGLFTKPSDLQDREYIMVLVKSAMNGCHLLKSVNLAACIYIHTCSTLNIQLTTKAWALFENIKAWPIFIPFHSPCVLYIRSLVACAKYDEQFISHG